jgi:hypothetical protein
MLERAMARFFSLCLCQSSCLPWPHPARIRQHSQGLSFQFLVLIFVGVCRGQPVPAIDLCPSLRSVWVVGWVPCSCRAPLGFAFPAQNLSAAVGAQFGRRFLLVGFMWRGPGFVFLCMDSTTLSFLVAVVRALVGAPTAIAACFPHQIQSPEHSVSFLRLYSHRVLSSSPRFGSFSGCHQLPAHFAHAIGTTKAILVGLCSTVAVVVLCSESDQNPSSFSCTGGVR